MKGVILITIGCLALAGASCSTLEVSSDHDPRAQFSRYKTFAWSPELKNAPPAADATGVPSDLVEGRVRAAIEAQLSKKGLRPAPEGTQPDILVSHRIIHKERVEGSSAGYSLGVGYGYGPWFGAYGGPSFPSVRQYTEGTLIVDLVDSRDKRLVWRGVASDAEEAPGENPAKIDKTVAETFRLYPPERAGQG